MNRLRDGDIMNIVDAHRDFETKEKYAYRATYKEVAEQNEYNLNIPRYVDTFEPEPEVDLRAVAEEVRSLEGKLAETRVRIDQYLKELGYGS